MRAVNRRWRRGFDADGGAERLRKVLLGLRQACAARSKTSERAAIVRSQWSMQP